MYYIKYTDKQCKTINDYKTKFNLNLDNKQYPRILNHSIAVKSDSVKEMIKLFYLYHDTK